MRTRKNRGTFNDALRERRSQCKEHSKQQCCQSNVLSFKMVNVSND